MLSWIKNNWLLASLLSLLAIVSVYLANRGLYFALVYVSFLGSLLYGILIQSKSLVKFYFLLVFFAPISIGIVLFGGFKISAPTEMLTLGFLLLVFIKLIWGLKLNFDFLSHPISILVLLDLAWSFFTTITSEIFPISMKRFLLKAIFVLCYFIFFQAVTTFKNRHKMFFWYGIGALLPVSLIILMHAQTGFIQGTSFSVCKPFFDDHTLYAACLAFILPFFILQIGTTTGKKKLLYGIASCVFLFALLTSYSRAAWISLLVAGFLFILLKFQIKLRYLVYLFVIGIVSLVFNFDTIYNSLRESEAKYDDNITTHLSSVTNLQNDASNLERINRWVCAYRMFEARPLTGFGPGTYQFVYNQFQTKEYMTRISTRIGNKGNAHSEYFMELSESGLLGFLFFTVLVFYSIYIGLRVLSKMRERNERIAVLSALLGLITFYVHGLFNTFSDQEKMAVLILGSLGILVQYDQQLKKLDESEA